MYLTEIEPDEIKTQIFRNLQVTKLFNDLHLHLIPEKLKLTVVYPIHKKDSKIKVNSYHPISILPKVNVLFYKKQNNT